MWSIPLQTARVMMLYDCQFITRAVCKGMPLSFYGACGREIIPGLPVYAMSKCSRSSPSLLLTVIEVPTLRLPFTIISPSSSSR